MSTHVRKAGKATRRLQTGTQEEGRVRKKKRGGCNHVYPKRDLMCVCGVEAGTVEREIGCVYGVGSRILMCGYIYNVTNSQLLADVLSTP
jgi:hypothetical protein